MPVPRTLPIQKVCPSCCSTFDVCPPGKFSRYLPRSGQVFCSVECARKGRYRSGTKCKTLIPTEAAYIAGFLDGEGFIILYKRRDTVAMRAGFTNTNLRVLRRIQRMVGGGGFSHQKRRKPHHKTGHSLNVNAELAESLLLQIRPFLILKSEQADLAIEFQRKLRNPSLKSSRSWQYEALEQMKRLNRRGPNLQN